jgi:hypothetical protein
MAILRAPRNAASIAVAVSAAARWSRKWARESNCGANRLSSDNPVGMASNITAAAESRTKTVLNTRPVSLAVADVH